MPKWENLYAFPEILEEIGESKRRFMRYPIENNQTVLIANSSDEDNFIPLTMTEISRGGFALSDTPEQFEENRIFRVNLDFLTKNTNISLESTAILARKGDDGNGGFQFFKPSKEVQSALVDFVKGLERTRVHTVTSLKIEQNNHNSEENFATVVDVNLYKNEEPTASETEGSSNQILEVQTATVIDSNIEETTSEVSKTIVDPNLYAEINTLETERTTDSILKEEEHTSEELWFVSDNNESTGPYNKDQLFKELKAKHSLTNIFIWKDGMEKWESLYKFPEMLEEMGLSKRRFMRYDIEELVMISSSEDRENFLPMTMVDISRAGFTALDIPSDYITGQKFLVRLSFLDHENPIFAESILIRKEVNSTGGFQFHKLSVDTQEMLINFIKGLEATRIQTVTSLNALKETSNESGTALKLEPKEETIETTTEEWFLALNNENTGPFSKEELLLELKDKDSLTNAFIWKEGMSKWESLYKFPKLLEEVGLSKRRFMRYTMEELVMISPIEDKENRLPMSMVNLSRGGFTIVDLPHSFKKDRIYSIKLNFLEEGEPVYAQAKLIRLEPNSEAGFEFIKPSAELQSLLVDYVKGLEHTRVQTIIGATDDEDAA